MIRRGIIADHSQTVLAVVRDALRDLQRQIDSRLQTSANWPRFVRRSYARIRGISPGELALRDGLPVLRTSGVLIQHESGLLLAHYAHEGVGTDSDLVSGMLTAIRDFVRIRFRQRKVNTNNLTKWSTAISILSFGAVPMLMWLSSLGNRTGWIAQSTVSLCHGVAC